MPIRHQGLGPGKQLFTRKGISNVAQHLSHPNGLYLPVIASISELENFFTIYGFFFPTSLKSHAVMAASKDIGSIQSQFLIGNFLVNNYQRSR